MKGWLRGVAALVALVAFFIGIRLADESFSRIEDFRKLERIPLTTVMGSVGGETQLAGEAIATNRVLTAPFSEQPALYFRYLEEEERRDSDGDTYWHTLRDLTRSTEFDIADHSGRVQIDHRSNHSAINWSVAQKLRRTIGKRRHTEWRIDPGDRISVFGWFDADLERMDFLHSGAYVPIISSFDSAHERSEIGFSAILYLWGGVSLFILMCLGIMVMLKAHRTLLFLILITVSTSALLLQLGWQSLASDVGAGAERISKQMATTEARINAVLQQHGLAFPGWQTAFDLESPDFAALNDAQRKQVNAWRNTSFELRARYLQQISRFPESLYARLTRQHRPTPIALPAAQLAIARENLSRYASTRTPTYILYTLAGFVLIAVSAWLAFLQIRVKRMQENLPTAKTSGITYGLTETSGALVAEDSDNLLTGPLSSRPCTWYHYRVMERRGSGKNARWVTIIDRTRKQPFLCRDSEGEIRVFPSQAEVHTRHKLTESSGNRRYSERRLEPDDSLYILGKATPDRTRGDSLVIRHDSEHPYLIANIPEHEVMFIKASRGMGMLSAGISLLFLCALTIGGSNGNFSSVDFLASSLIAPTFLGIIMLIFMYNDLVFLRQRSTRNWANILVSLKKRADLVPQLEEMVRSYFAHEQTLQTRLSALRTLVATDRKAVNTADSQQVDNYARQEHQLIADLRARIENYPDISAQPLVRKLTDRLVKLENELAMIRAGFNDAVMLYNTRIETFPDNVLARAFRFEKLSTLKFDEAPHALAEAPSVSL